MRDWLPFWLTLLAFCGTHFLPALGLRDWLIARLGRRTYFTAYGTLSLLLLYVLIVIATQAPYQPIWFPAGRWLANLIMPFAIWLAVWGIGTDWRTLGGRPGPGTGPAALSRHPLLLALALWSLAHLPPNGDAAHVVLFGLFAAMALVAIPLADRRTDSAPPPLLSLRPLLDPVWRRAQGGRLLRRTALALCLWVLIYGLHAPVIGVSPHP